MPKSKVDYQTTVIYKIVCNDFNVKDLYVGHTTDFRSRKNCHKKSCCNPNSKKHNFTLYKSIRENGGWSNWTMVEVEKFPCNDSNEATAREQFWYEQFCPTLNMRCPHNDDREKYKIYQQNYYLKKKETQEKTPTTATRETQTDPIPDKILVKRIKPRVSREQIIIFYYDMLKQDKAFAIWIRNIRRVNIEFFTFEGLEKA